MRHLVFASDEAGPARSADRRADMVFWLVLAACVAVVAGSLLA